MSGDLYTATATIGRVNQAVNSVATLANAISNLLGGGNFQEASWRGIRFACRENRVMVGRRVAVHDYPYKPVSWAEDLGKLPRRMEFEGFLLGTNPVLVDVTQLRDQMIAACETQGAGDLVHPTLGKVSAVLLSNSIGEVWDKRNAVNIQLGFLIVPPANQPTQPAATLNTQTTLGNLASNLGLGSVASFVNRVAGYVSQGLSYVNQGIAVVSSVMGAVTGFVAAAEGLMGDAGLVASAVSGLADGNYYGRYAAGSRTAAQPGTQTITSLIQGAVQARATVATEGAAAATAAGAVAASPSALGPALVAVTEAVRAGCSDPADAVRLLLELCDYQAPASGAPTSSAGIVATATAALARRAAIQSIANAVATYQPTSYDDGVALQTTVTDAIDAETVIAADAGDDDTYSALLALRTGVVNDLQTRALLLPRLITVTRATSLPAWKLAQQLYADGSRVDDLIARVGNACPHPAFMPLSFQALAD